MATGTVANSMAALLLVSTLLFTSGIGAVQARKPIQVGGPCGWAEGCTDYINWYKTTPLKKGSQVAFKYSGFHDVFQFDSEAAWKACNFSSGKFLSTGPTAGQGKGVIVDVTEKPKYIACSIPFFLGAPPIHCLAGQKVIIKAGLGKRQFKLDWVLGGLTDFQKVVNKRKHYKIGETFAFKYQCCHNVWTMVDEEHYKACNFTGGKELGGFDAGTVVVPITDKPSYIGCSVEPHCSLGQKVMLPAGR